MRILLKLGLRGKRHAEWGKKYKQDRAFPRVTITKWASLVQRGTWITTPSCRAKRKLRRRLMVDAFSEKGVTLARGS